MSSTPEHEISGGNVFADLGLADADNHQLKARLVSRIAEVMKKRDLNQVQTATILGIGQPDVSKLLKGHFEKFSAERLMRFLTDLGCAVDIVIWSDDRQQATDTIRLHATAQPS